MAEILSFRVRVWGSGVCDSWAPCPGQRGPEAPAATCAFPAAAGAPQAQGSHWSQLASWMVSVEVRGPLEDRQPRFHVRLVLWKNVRSSGHLWARPEPESWDGTQMTRDSNVVSPPAPPTLARPWLRVGGRGRISPHWLGWCADLGVETSWSSLGSLAGLLGATEEGRACPLPAAGVLCISAVPALDQMTISESAGLLSGHWGHRSSPESL